MLTVAVTPKAQNRKVRYNKRSLVISMVLMLNLVSMPWKAYFSEPLPWTANSCGIPYECYLNFTLCAPVISSFFHNQSQAFTRDQRSLTTDNFDLFQVNFPLVPAEVEDKTSYALRLPYSVFFTREEISKANLLAQAEGNVSSFRTVNVAQFFGIYINYKTMWAIEGTTDNEMFLGVMLIQMSFVWLLFKFLYRLCLSIYIFWHIWKYYYRHYLHLTKNLPVFGLYEAPRACTFEIIVGDPTSIILLNPNVSLCFVIDFWIRVDFVGRAFVRIIQLTGIKEFVLAYLYLSRTLWFGYGTLSVVSYLLKKFHHERYFYGVDPTWTAIGIAIAAGPLTLLQSRIDLLVQFYNILFTSVVQNDHELELSLPSVLYTIILGTLPVLFGFIPHNYFQNACNKVFAQARTRFNVIQTSSYLYNDMKNRWTLTLVFFTIKKANITTIGGSVYNLFKLDNKYKKHLGISQCGADCYVKWSSGVDEWTCCRLSLLACMDVQSPMEFVVSKHGSAVGKVEMEDGCIRVTQGSNSSPWIS